MFLPGPGIVAGFLADVSDGRDLDVVFEGRGTLHGQAVADIDADVAGDPQGFAGGHAPPVPGRHVLALLDHAVGSDVGDAVRSVGRAAVDVRLVARPAPQNPFDQTDTVKTEGVGAGGLDHSGPGRLFVVAVILGVPGLIGGRHRRAEAPHDVQGFVILGRVDQFFDKGFTFHHCRFPPLQARSPGFPRS